MDDTALGVRWSIGDASDEGFEALRLSVFGARKVFGERASLAICVHGIDVEDARTRAGALPDGVRWQHVERDLPAFFAERIADGVDARDIGWKLVPIRLFPDRFELSLDSGCILWELPVTVSTWIADNHPTRCLVVEDVRVCGGRFAGEEPQPRNTCLRGLPPGFDLEAALARELAQVDGHLVSDLDELGLQIAALSRHEPPCVVPVTDVTVCSPFPPHHLALGRCGAHFVGIDGRADAHEGTDPNARDDGGRVPLREHWRRHRARLHELVGLAEAHARDGDAARVAPTP
jgi:hypothetical protein